MIPCSCDDNVWVKFSLFGTRNLVLKQFKDNWKSECNVWLNKILLADNVSPRSWKTRSLSAEATFADTTIGYLEADDNDNTDLEFAIQGEIANSILRLVRVGPKKMEIRLNKKLDREVFWKRLSRWSQDIYLRKKLFGGKIQNTN